MKSDLESPSVPSNALLRDPLSGDAAVVTLFVTWTNVASSVFALLEFIMV